jgi:hypothetical protein
MYSALGILYLYWAFFLLLGITYSVGFRFCGFSVFLFTFWAIIEDSGLSFYHPLSLCFMPWPWVL